MLESIIVLCENLIVCVIQRNWSSVLCEVYHLMAGEIVYLLEGILKIFFYAKPKYIREFVRKAVSSRGFITFQMLTTTSI